MFFKKKDIDIMVEKKSEKLIDLITLSGKVEGNISPEHSTFNEGINTFLTNSQIVYKK